MKPFRRLQSALKGFLDFVRFLVALDKKLRLWQNKNDRT